MTTHNAPSWPTIVLGGSGYVAGEFLRLVALHPNLALEAIVSTSQAGEPVAKTFGHLAPAYPSTVFEPLDAVIARLGEHPHWVVLSAAPPGAAAGIIHGLLGAAEAAGVTLTVVDASADFRFADPDAYAAVYGHAHPAQARLREFVCAVPEHASAAAIGSARHAAHPGCFATAMLLAIVPLARSGLAEDAFFVSAVTGSTGAGRTLRETTHHPVRQNNLFAYQTLEHRHAPEVRALVNAASQRSIALNFVPHSGPFARGIHATVFATPKAGVTQAQLDEAFAEAYRGAHFVQVASEPPRMKDIVATNYAALNVKVANGAIAACSVVDNLTKGAAGGSIQWANRLLGLAETTGLTATSGGWL
jgi:N-acetyl-gamma-glutamyl-phosphate reductase